MVKVSVIIPIYNVEKYIEECICSVLKQTLREIEIICVNDGTKDNSMSVVEKYQLQDDRIIILNKENGGLSSARNFGLQHAQGEFVYFLDSDDYIKKEMLEILYNHAKSDELDNIYFDAEAFYESAEVERQNENYKTYYCRPGIFQEVCSGMELFARMENLKCYRPSACLQMIRREFLIEKNIRFYEGIIHEDQLFSLQVIFQANRVKHVAVALYMRRVRSESIMTTEQEFANSFGYFICLVEFRKFIEKFELKDEAIIRAVKQRLRGLQSLAIADIKKLSYQDLEKEIRKYPLHLQYEYDALIKRLVEERQKHQSQQSNLSRKIQKVKKTTTFKVGKTIMFFPKKIVSACKMLISKGFICTLYAFKRKLTREKKLLETDRILVSVIMPIYNAEKYLRVCLNQLCCQTLRAIEIICVNDGSEDGSQAILEEFASKDSRIKVLYQENQGAGNARNNGMNHAQGEYLLFLDADDIYSKKLCEEAYYKARYDMADIVLFGANRLNMKTAEKETMGWVLKKSLLPKRIPFSVKNMSDKIYQVTTACPWSKMFRAEFVRKQGLQFQNTKNANDVFFVRTALAVAKRITVLDKCLITYRYNDGDNIQSGKSKAPIEFYKAFKALKEELIQREVYKRIEQSYVNMVLKESLFNLRTAGTEEAKQLILDILLNEGFSFFELSQYDESYFYEKKEYEEYKALLQQIKTM